MDGRIKSGHDVEGAVVKWLGFRGREAGEGAGEFFGVEGAEVGGLFAGADGVDGEAEQFGEGDDDAAAGAAVEFGDDEAGEVHHVLENLDLGDGVLARCRIEC